MSMRYMISADANGRKDMSDGSPIESYYGYDYDSATVDGAVFSCSRKQADELAQQFRRVWAEQGHDVSYTVEPV